MMKHNNVLVLKFNEKWRDGVVVEIHIKIILFNLDVGGDR